MLYIFGMTARTSKELEQIIIAEYLEGNSSQVISSRLGCSRSTCLEVLRRNGIKTRTPQEARYRIPQQHEQAIIAAYLNGASSKEAATQFGYAQQTCIDILRRNGIEPRNSLEVSRKYTVDYRFFDTIDTEEKAYWLGFLTADGGIVGNELTLALQVEDKEHLQKFATSLHSEHPIIFRESNRDDKIHQYAYIRICSEQIVKSLARLGLGKQKSLIVKPCPLIPQHLLHHYWRGLVDGDGSIGYNKAIQSWSIRLWGTEAIVTGFSQFLNQFITSKAKVSRDKSVFKIAYMGNRLTATIIQVLYADAAIYLDRKMELARSVIDRQPPKP